VEKELLNLTPKKYLCPICGEWHEWKHPYPLGFYNPNFPAAFANSSVCPRECAEDKYTIFVNGEYLHYTTGEMCEHASLNLDGRIPIESIIEYADQPIVAFDVHFTAKEAVGEYETDCRNCSFLHKCNLIELSEKGGSIDMKIPLGFEFEQSEYMRFAKVGKIERQAEQSAQQEIREDTTMANNMFNMNMEFGTSRDKNIASTLMGVAVKKGDSWRIYDKKKKEITDVGNMQLGNLPIFILPTTKLNEGDLIKDAGEYYFVIKVAKESTQTLCAKTGEMKNVIPIKNVLGFSCYSKVIALSDSINMGDDFDVEKLAIMSAMCGQSDEDGGQMNQLLPLMLFKDKLGGDDDMMKMMLMTSMMSVPAEGGDQNATMNQLLPLMLLKEKGGGDDDMMKMVLMSSMMGDNMAGNNNPVMSYLMLDMLMSKKNDEQPLQQSDK
jgi:hypothetical protein